jgi:hypothetical protein
MLTFDEISKALTNKGYMPTKVTIDVSRNALKITTPFALNLTNKLRKLGSNATYNSFEESVLITDSPVQFFDKLEAL